VRSLQIKQAVPGANPAGGLGQERHLGKGMLGDLR
jgi:hypothetical protein